MIPGVSKFDIRKIDHSLDYRGMVGAAVGFILGTVVLSPAPLIKVTAHRALGYPWGQIALIVYKLLAVYIVILLLAKRSDTE